MRKLLAITMVLIFLLSAAACSSNKYEDRLIGTWVTSSGGMSILYSFEKDGDKYTASCMTRSGDSDFYMFDKYTASGSTITFYQDGKSTKEYYKFKDGYLYIDNLEFEKIG